MKSSGRNVSPRDRIKRFDSQFHLSTYQSVAQHILHAVTMSVAGFDIGSQTCTVAVARKRGIDVVLNKESNRETPAIVSFTTKDRQMGTDAVGSLTVNPKNTISQIKRLIGKNFKSPAVQRDIARYPFKVVEAPDGGCLVEVEYLEETRQFSPVQLMAMVLFDNRQVALADGSPVTDCVVTVPVFYAEVRPGIHVHHFNRCHCTGCWLLARALPNDSKGRRIFAHLHACTDVRWNTSVNSTILS